MVKIKLFGMLKERLQKDVIEFDLPKEPISSSDLMAALKTQETDLNQLSSLKLAVNQSLVEDQHLINKTDELALLPPFSGG